MLDLSKMTYDELEALHSATFLAMQEIKDERRDELIQQVCDAMNDLHAEFPYVELPVSYRCVECGYDDDVNALYVFCHDRKLKPEDFVR